MRFIRSVSVYPILFQRTSCKILIFILCDTIQWLPTYRCSWSQLSHFLLRKQAMYIVFINKWELLINSYSRRVLWRILATSHLRIELEIFQRRWINSRNYVCTCFVFPRDKVNNYSRIMDHGPLRCLVHVAGWSTSPPDSSPKLFAALILS